MCVCVCVCVCACVTIIMCMCELGYLEKQCNDQIFHIPALQVKYGEKYAECGLGLLTIVFIMVYKCAYSTVRHACAHLNIRSIDVIRPIFVRYFKDHSGVINWQKS